jgi:hypothetical protein
MTFVEYFAVGNVQKWAGSEKWTRDDGMRYWWVEGRNVWFDERNAGDREARREVLLGDLVVTSLSRGDEDVEGAVEVTQHSLGGGEDSEGDFEE